MPNKPTMTRKCSLPKLSFRAEVWGANTEKRTASLVWSQGAKVLRSNFWDGTFFEQLSMDPAHIRMDRLKSGRAPLLDTHGFGEGRGLRSQIGVVESADVKNGQGDANVRFSKREDVEPIFQDVVDKIVQNVSVGYRVYKFERQPQAEGEEIPTFLAVDWEPIELSMVPAGADPDASIRSDEAETNECIFVDPVTGRNVGEGEKMPKIEDKKSGVESPVTREPEKKPELDLEAIRAQAVKEAQTAERKRVSDIMNECKRTSMTEDFASKMVSEGKALDEVRSEIINVIAERSEKENPETRSHVSLGSDASDKFREGAVNWIGIRSGKQSMIEKHTGQKLDAGEFRGLSLLDLARESLIQSGVQVRGLDKMALVAKAFTHRSGYHSTSDFPLLLEEALHKTLLAAYAMAQDSWSRFSAKGSVSDFRSHKRYRTGSFGRLDKVLENGEFKDKSIPDAERESITAETYGNMIKISRQAIVNDDMEAFGRLPSMLGRAAGLSVEIDVFALLASNPTMSDGVALFHADHGNLLSSGGAPSVAEFDAMRVAIAEQKDISGNEYLDLRTFAWVGPIGLGGDARVVNDAQYDPDTANKLQKPNKVRGLFADIVDTPRLSGNPYYAFADPSIAPVIEVAFLDGQESPVLETKEGWSIDGVEWKVRHDYGVAAVDFRGVVKNPGE